MTDIDINEKSLYEKYPTVLDLLLLDNTTKKNIIWATNSYKRRGYRFSDNILPINVIKGNIIQPRSKKQKQNKQNVLKIAQKFLPLRGCVISRII